MTNTPKTTVLVTGATGYVGSRLIPRLLQAGYRVRAVSRSLDNLRKRPWWQHPQVELCRMDIMDPESVKSACRGCYAVFYLIHAMTYSRDFAESDRRAAEYMVAAAAAAGVERIIYLGGLGELGQDLSKHLRSRMEVSRILHDGKVPVTTLRAAMIIGTGSASFEILCYLVRRLPIMVTPRWVDTECQPISIRNVLMYLTGCLDVPATSGETFDIGGEDVVTYRCLMKIFAAEAGLAKRWVIPVPVLTPRLSSYWIHLVTPIPGSLARPLTEGLRNRVVCQDSRIRSLVSQELLDSRTAVRRAVDRRQCDAPDPGAFGDDNGFLPPEWRYPGDIGWAGGGVGCR